jgi:hypothetical protein
VDAPIVALVEGLSWLGSGCTGPGGQAVEQGLDNRGDELYMNREQVNIGQGPLFHLLQEMSGGFLTLGRNAQPA